MTRRISKALLAGALGVGMLAAAPTFAQQQLDASVAEGLAALGVNSSEYGMVTADQALQIQNVLNSSDDEVEKANRIRQILGTDSAAAAPSAASQLRDSVSAEMARLGMDADTVDMLAMSQVGQIEAVTNSTDPDDRKRDRIEEIVGTMSSVTPMAAMQLRDSVSAELAALGVSEVEVSALTLSQVAEMENVLNSQDTDDTKRLRVEQIAAQ